MPTFIGLIHKDPGSDFGVSFPDLPGCVTAAPTLEEARFEAQEALTLHLRGLEEDGETPPVPSTLDEIMADPANRDALAILAVAPEPQPKTLRVNVTMPEDVLGEIDRYAARHGLSRSGFLVRAARAVMSRERA